MFIILIAKQPGKLCFCFVGALLAKLKLYMHEFYVLRLHVFDLYLNHSDYGVVFTLTMLFIICFQVGLFFRVSLLVHSLKTNYNLKTFFFFFNSVSRTHSGRFCSSFYY